MQQGDEPGPRSLFQDQLVEPADDIGDVVTLPGQDPQRVPGQAGNGRRFRAGAADVADREPPAVLPGRENVVEVAADLVALAGDLVRHRQVHAGDAGQLWGQQASLQGLAGQLLLFVEPGVVERERGAAGEVLGQLERFARRPVGTGAADHDHAEAPAPRRQGEAPGRVGGEQEGLVGQRRARIHGQ